MTTKYVPSPLARNKPLEEVSLTDVLIEHARTLNLKLNCHAIAQIQDFNSAKQTVTATINYQREVVKRNENGTYSVKAQNYPVLSNVPVIILSGGNANLTFPIQKGDDCLILFNDRDMDTWLSSATIQPPNSSRLHDFSDAVALVGIKPFTKSISGYDTSRVRLQNGETYVGVSETHLKLANNLTSLKEILDDLIAALNTSPLVAVTGSPGAPSPINPAITTKLSALSTKIGNLLE
jgi:hypothetical protein